MKNYRHGDMALVGVSKLPEGLQKSDSAVLMTGSGGNNHTVRGGVFYPRFEDTHIVGYLVAGEGCELLHPEHGDRLDSSGLVKVAPVEPGVYAVRRQTEDTHDGMKPVED